MNVDLYLVSLQPKVEFFLLLISREFILAVFFVVVVF